MYCQKCGNPLQEGAQFCVKCGAPVGGVQAPLGSERKAPTRSGSRLIVPAIFAIVAAVAFLTCWVVGLRNVNWMIREAADEPILAVYAIDQLLENLFWITGAVLLFVFCLTARKSKKTFLFALACLAFAGGFAFDLLSSPATASDGSMLFPGSCAVQARCCSCWKRSSRSRAGSTS